MKLTNKCKEDFEKWSLENKVLTKSLGGYCVQEGVVLVEFNKLPDTMKFGVYQDFFDTVGIYIECYIDCIDTYSWNVNIKTLEVDYHETHCTSRSDANICAIKQANNIYNERV
jgi:hypothetical protein